MSRSKSSQSSSTTNITETITTTQVASDGGSALSINAEEFRGDIGLTGFDAVQVVREFTDLQRDRDLLNAQNTANIMRLSQSSGPQSIVIPSAGPARDEEPRPAGTRTQNAVLLLGGAAAVATIVALMR